jgi:hypothetical protein
MEAFISGGAGFIGSHLERRLLFRKCAKRALIFKFTGGERVGEREAQVIRFNCLKKRFFGWRSAQTSGDALTNSMNAIREEILHA